MQDYYTFKTDNQLCIKLIFETTFWSKMNDPFIFLNFYLNFFQDS